MSEPYDPVHVEIVGRFLDERRLLCGFQTLKSLADAASIDPKTLGWLISGRPDNVSGARFAPSTLHQVTTALKLPTGSIETALQTGDLTAFEPSARRASTPSPPMSEPTKLAAISRDLYSILWRLPVGEASRVHLSAAINEIEKAIHSYPDTDTDTDSP